MGATCTVVSILALTAENRKETVRKYNTISLLSDQLWVKRRRYAAIPPRVKSQQVGQTKRHWVTTGTHKKHCIPTDNSYTCILFDSMSYRGLTSGDGDHNEVRAFPERVFLFIPSVFFEFACEEVDCIAFLCCMGDEIGLVGRLVLTVLFQGSIITLFSERRPLVAHGELKPKSNMFGESSGVLGRDAEPCLGLDFC